MFQQKTFIMKMILVKNDLFVKNLKYIQYYLNILIRMGNIIQNFIEVLYIYKTSYLYYIHIGIMVLIFLAIVVMTVK